MDTILYSVLTLGILGLVAGGILSYAAKRFSVFLDPRVEKLAHILPGANCGACGYASCIALAKAVLSGLASANSCIAGGEGIASKVSEIVGKTAVSTVKLPKVAVVQCQGGRSKAKERFKYIGIEDCNAALLIAGGHKACIYGCLGLGTCVKICPFDAVTMSPDGLPVIDEDKCIACGKCIKVCTRGIITLIPRGKEVYLACVSKDKAKKVREVCKAGCIACGICIKPSITPEGLITMVENLPEIHWEEGKDLKNLLEQTVKKCPNKCFVVR